MNILLALAAFLFGAGAALAQEADCSSDASDVRAIHAVAEGIVDADNQRDIARVMAYYVEDAVLMPPDLHPVVGRPSIRPRYERLFAGFRPSIENQIEEACVSGGLGFVRGHTGGSLQPEPSGDPVQLDDAYLMLLRMGADGTWRISHLMWHPRTPH